MHKMKNYGAKWKMLNRNEKKKITGDCSEDKKIRQAFKVIAIDGKENE